MEEVVLRGGGEDGVEHLEMVLDQRDGRTIRNYWDEIIITTTNNQFP
jgi:hypothetical protein